MFSRRVPLDLRPNALAEAAKARGGFSCDLTVSNPTAVGIEYPADLLTCLADPGSLAYRPDPKGMRSAREIVAASYAARGTAVDPDRIVLCASTSEAYGLLFRLLCDPGDAVLVPVPSYPLFDHLAALDAVRARPYLLDSDLDGQPHLGPDDVRGARAILVVHPNNPTGHHVAPETAARLASLCTETSAALVADEVFLDFPLDGSPRESFAARGECLTFTLGGLSKSVGLPQLKLAWIVVSGPERVAADAVERLEYVNDAYLSASTPVQRALPDLLRRGEAIREAILARCLGNLATLARIFDARGAVHAMHPEGGWSAVLRIPAIDDDETVALTLLREDGVAVHPGSFFGFPAPGRLVVSLLPDPSTFEEGVRRLRDRLSTT
jgi:aspartate/methionine/tyrosine aminotransferase